MDTSITVLVLTCAVFITAEYIVSGKSLSKVLITRAGIIASNSTAALAVHDKANAADVLSALRYDSHIVAACLYDKDGHVFAKYPAARGRKSCRDSP